LDIGVKRGSGFDGSGLQTGFPGISCLFMAIPVRLPGLLPYPFVSSGTGRGARPGLAGVFILFPEEAPPAGY